MQQIKTPFMCAVQLKDTHAYTPKPWPVETTYFFDGVRLYTRGDNNTYLYTILDDKVCARDSHYGSMGRTGKYEDQSVLHLVTKYYSSHFAKCHKARALGQEIPEMPPILEFSVSYCGN